MTFISERIRDPLAQPPGSHPHSAHTTEMTPTMMSLPTAAEIVESLESALENQLPVFLKDLPDYNDAHSLDCMPFYAPNLDILQAYLEARLLHDDDNDDEAIDDSDGVVVVVVAAPIESQPLQINDESIPTDQELQDLETCVRELRETHHILLQRLAQAQHTATKGMMISLPAVDSSIQHNDALVSNITQLESLDQKAQTQLQRLHQQQPTTTGMIGRGGGGGVLPGYLQDRQNIQCE